MLCRVHSKALLSSGGSKQSWPAVGQVAHKAAGVGCHDAYSGVVQSTVLLRQCGEIDLST